MGQSWEPWEELYSDGSITVKVSYQLSSNSCDPQWAIQNKYKYKLSGSLKSRTQFVNWKMAYQGCDGHIYYQQHSINIGAGGSTNQSVESMDWQFEGKRLVNPHFDVVVSSYKDENNSPQVPTPGMPISQLEIKIDKSQTLCTGSSVNLTSTTIHASGPIVYQWQQSSDGLSWSDINGSTNQSYSTPSLHTTTYYRCMVTDSGAAFAYPAASNAVTITIADPTVIISGERSICKGGKVFLNAETTDGGKNGSFQWQSSGSSTGFTDISGARYATFSSPEIFSPVNYQCVYTPHNLNCPVAVSKPAKVNLIQSPVVTAGNDNIICSGGSTNITAQVTGNNSGIYNWQQSGDRLTWIDIPSSNSYSLQTPPLYATMYFRATFEIKNAGCSKSNSNPVKIEVTRNATVTVSGNTKIKVGRNTILTAKADKTNGNYQWQKSASAYYWENIYIGGTSDKLTTEKLNTNTYYRCSYKTPGVNCEAYSQQLLVTVRQPLWHSTFFTNDKFMHVSLGAGLEMGPRPLPGIQTKQTSNGFGGVYEATSKTVVPFVLGARGDFRFHPLMIDYVSLGVNVGGGVATVPITLIGGKTNNGNYQESYLTYKLDLGTEFAAGAKAFKFLFVYQSSLQTHRYKKIVKSSYELTTYTANVNIRRETMNLGMRIGRYNANRSKGKVYKHPFCIDLFYSFGWDRRFNWAPLELSNAVYAPYHHGAGMAIWVQSIFNLRVDVYPAAIKTAGSSDEGKTLVQASLIYNADWFRGKR